jgi:EAL domain-containing protein (putative c-di-GMP-specific phosphodiesterase class I)
VSNALDGAGLSADRLNLEVTESALMRDPEGVVATLHRLRARGVRIALDDFGTGYSSLSYLRRFPFDKIKIDRTFIKDIAEPDAAAIVRAVVGLGERLEMSIVAEGVETAEQLDLVRSEGCDEVQGFLFSRPLPANEVQAFLRSGRMSAAA